MARRGGRRRGGQCLGYRPGGGGGVDAASRRRGAEPLDLRQVALERSEGIEAPGEGRARAMQAAQGARRARDRPRVAEPSLAHGLGAVDEAAQEDAARRIGVEHLGADAGLRCGARVLGLGAAVDDTLDAGEAQDVDAERALDAIAAVAQSAEPRDVDRGGLDASKQRYPGERGDARDADTLGHRLPSVWAHLTAEAITQVGRAQRPSLHPGPAGT